VLPNLERENTVVVRLRGYQDPVDALERELRLPGVVWQKAAPDTADLPSLLERASRYLGSRRLLIVLDQFEEFVILQDPDKHERFNQLMAALKQRPLEGVTLLFVFRCDYIGVVEKLALPPMHQDTNWKLVPQFTESAARDFMRGSGLQVGDDLLRDVLREAAEIEQTKGLIRPITINLCGLVLGRFATGLPRGFRPGQLIRGFLRESVSALSIREVAPRIIPHLISPNLTKRPCAVADLARRPRWMGPRSAVVCGCWDRVTERLCTPSIRSSRPGRSRTTFWCRCSIPSWRAGASPCGGRCDRGCLGRGGVHGGHGPCGRELEEGPHFGADGDGMAGTENGEGFGTGVRWRSSRTKSQCAAANFPASARDVTQDR
jgi:hypothetical protein